MNSKSHTWLCSVVATPIAVSLLSCPVTCRLLSVKDSNKVRAAIPATLGSCRREGLAC